MEKILLFSIFSLAAGLQETDPASNQMVDFKKQTRGAVGKWTTGSGAPVNLQDATSSLNSNILNNNCIMENLINVAQERTPARIIHAKGLGAFGYFETTKDISHICKADMFSEVGKRTPVAVRFSGSKTAKGAVDTQKDTRGFSVKFYTGQGNLDLVMFNTPIIFGKDPTTFPNLVHAIRRNPATNLPDANMLWDHLITNPEAFFIFMFLFGDRGLPASYRHMPGHSIHTYEVYNNNGTKSAWRWNFMPEAGIKNMNSSEALKIAASDTDYYTRDLYNAIAKGNFPSWQVCLQILSQKNIAEAREKGFDVFDVTKMLHEKDYPMECVGRLVLDRNPTNHFSQIEKLALCPANIVPGILGAPDKIFEARRLFYRDAQNYRLGVNHNNIPVNYPINSPALTYYRDGREPVNDNGGDMPNYHPNNFNGPIPYVDENKPALSQIYEEKADNFDQASDWYTNHMSPGEQMRYAQTAAASMCSIDDVLKQRGLETFEKINLELRNAVAETLEKMQC